MVSMNALSVCGKVPSVCTGGGGTLVPCSQVEYNVLADQLRRLATDRKTVGRNRKRLYNLCKR